MKLMGGLVSMSSTALVIRLLSDEAQIDAPQGRLAVSVLVFQDLAIVPFLLAIPFLAGGGETSAPGLALSVFRMLAALALVLFIVRVGVPRVLRLVAQARSPDLFSLLALLIVLGCAFLAEELGLIGVLAVLAGFVMLLVAGSRIATRARDRFTLLVAFGMTMLLTVPGLINAAVVMGMIPTKGLTLPFLSYGRTSLVVCCVALGLLLSAARESQRPRTRARSRR